MRSSSFAPGRRSATALRTSVTESTGSPAALEDAIAAAKAGLVCRAAVDDLRELHAVLAVGLGELHAEVAVLDAAALDQLRDDRADDLDRHRVADADVAAGAALDLRVDADDAAAAVEQRAAGVAAVQRRVGLDRRRRW